MNNNTSGVMASGSGAPARAAHTLHRDRSPPACLANSELGLAARSSLPHPRVFFMSLPVLSTLSHHGQHRAVSQLTQPH